MATPNELPADEVRLHLVTDTIRRRWPTILLVMLILAGATAAYVSTAATSYTAVARVLVRPVPGNALSDSVTSSTGEVTVAMQTEATLVTSPDVTAIANAKLDQDVAPGSPAVVATVPENTEIVQVAFTASTAREAQSGAEAFAEAFLTYRGNLATSTIAYQAGSLERQARTAEADLKAASRTASSPTPPPDAASKVQLYASRLAALQASTGQLQTLDVRPGSLVTPAKLPGSPAGLNPLVLVVAAALLGLGAGLALAIWRERGDDRIRSGSQTTLHGVPVLANPPQDALAQLIIDPDATDAMKDAYRRAIVGILAAVSRPAVVVVSAVDKETRAEDVAVNLGIALRRSGRQVAIVDASCCDGAVATLLGLPDGPGLRDVLEHEVSLDAALQETHRVQVLTGGGDSGERQDHVLGMEMADLVEKLRGEFDFVVVAAPAASTAAGAAVAVAGDSLVLVATITRTTNQSLSEAIQRSHQLSVAVLGVVVNVRTDHGRSPQGRRAAKHAAALPPDLKENLRVLFPTPALISAPRRLSRRPRDASDYLLIPSTRKPKLMVPARPHRVAISEIRHYRPVRSGADRIRRTAAVTAIRVGLGGLVFGRVRMTAPAEETVPTITDHLREVMGSPVHFGLHLGPRRAVQKPVLQVMTPGGDVLGFAKVGATPFTRELVRHEASSLELLGSKNFNRLVLPPVIDHGQWRNHEVLVLQRLRGSDSARVDPAILIAAMKELSRCHRVTTTPLGSSTYWVRLGHRLGALPDSPVHRRLGAALDSIAATNGQTPVMFGSWHGDWTPWNMTTDGEHAMVWDWEKFEHDVPVGFDAVHHAVQGAVVEDGVSPTAAFDLVAQQAPTLLAPFEVSKRSVQLIVRLYAVEVATRYLEDGESEVGSTPMTRLSQWLPGLLVRDLTTHA